MEIERPNAKPLTREDLANLDRLKAVIERAIADGVLTADEQYRIKQVIYSNHVVSPEEMELVRELIWNKLSSGELVRDWGW
ncbi:hypothetical protein HPC62_06785 [Thermoleptolyngbya sichuanensis A183]|uniref:Uncharacterized protein n=1 Tax=Thermoleptolyngbya sichuanensis A183 TaxID=2737172 RepID=A0A6M8BE90_9CYAN|nr:MULTISPECIES: hypothetical protein [Thermoleptolyngbya]QKD81941.1 hypothetical protein HPC62_06785 [Thermoleptolyngbya sichuanensis A183]